MTALTSLLTPRFRAHFRRSPWTALAELAARAGYVARGFVYLSIGLMALMAALGVTPRAEGALGALEAWGAWPPGLALLWVTGLGLYGFAGWRALQALLDADRQGRSLKALAARAGQAISGAVYAGLGVSVFGLLDAIEDLRETDDQQATREAVAQALALPLGPWLVVGVGLFILGVGVGNIVQSLGRDFCRHLVCSRNVAGWATALGRTGYFARGVAFLPAGALTALAGWRSRSADARGLGGALETLKDQPFGAVILGLVALGLIAFGLFAFVEARYRTVRAEEAIERAT